MKSRVLPAGACLGGGAPRHAHSNGLAALSVPIEGAPPRSRPRHDRGTEAARGRRSRREHADRAVTEQLMLTGRNFVLAWRMSFDPARWPEAVTVADLIEQGLPL